MPSQQTSGNEPVRESLAERTHRTFSSLKVRNYRLYFIGQTISQCGTWMQGTAQALLVLRLSGSVTAVGLVIGIQTAPVLFLAPYGGILADRFSKRRLLFITQSVMGVLALALGVLVATGSVRLWMVYLLALGLGMANALDNPARQTFIHEMVDRSHLNNAVTLNSIIVNLSRVIGPAIAGVLIAQFGLAPCFILNAISFGAVLYCLYVMDPHQLMRSKPVAAAKGQLREGFAYVWKTPILRDVLIMMALVGTLTYEFMVSLPALAHLTFPGADATRLGLFMSMMGVGAVVGGLVTAGRRRATVRSLAMASFAFGVSMVLVCAAPSIWWAVAALTLVGFFSVSFTALTNTLLQISSKAHMRGRVMALWAMAFMGSTVVGGPAIGWVCDTIGPRWGLGIGAVAAVVAGMIGLSAMRIHDAAAEGPRSTRVEDGRAA